MKGPLRLFYQEPLKAIGRVSETQRAHSILRAGWLPAQLY